uniref:Homing endonuclease LAGLIDADG domain-containing protein n=1 Tax=Ogataea polymorpha TaxID=460523 RepID=S5TDT5_9ASCO|nr:hypothetical protein [Ogataea polymorpha]AGS44034.1 hypothetical protein [Ogataea polymorpha]
MKKINNQWICGIVDAEGNFNVNLSSKNKLTFSFKVTQKYTSIEILNNLKNYFKIGNIFIDNRKTEGMKYVIQNIKDIEKVVIPFFDENPLTTSKQLDFVDFKEIFILYKNTSKLDYNYINKKIKNMNNGRSWEERYDYYSNKELNLSKEWTTAFIDGEGCFYYYLSKSIKNNKTIYQNQPSLEISQSSHSVKLLNAIKGVFNNYGYLSPKYNINDKNLAKNSRSVNRLKIRQVDEIINLFDKYPLYSYKKYDYINWKKLILLKNKKRYTSPEGFLEMKKIKNSINKKELINSNFIDFLKNR